MLIDENILYKLSVDEKRTDFEIANLFGLSRTTVVKYRKSLNINKESAYQMRLKKFEEMLINEYSLNVINLKEKDKTKEYSLLVGNKRLCFLTCFKENKNGAFAFTLSEKIQSKKVDSIYAKKFNKGRIRKVYKNICDYLVLNIDLGFKNYYYVIPSEEIEENINGISIRLDSEKSKYQKYKNNLKVLL